jgi:Holin of 3TMs, for gene-transfer release
MDIGKFFGSMFGSAASGAAAPAASIVDGAQKIIGMFKLSPDVKAQLDAQLVAENIDLQKTELAAQLASVQGQLEVNKAEAESTNMFIAGWRPAVGWVCVLALAWAYVFQPFVEFFLTAAKVKLPQALPHLDTGTLISGLLIPLLGVAVLRTVEKVANAEGNR